MCDLRRLIPCYSCTYVGRVGRQTRTYVHVGGLVGGSSGASWLYVDDIIMTTLHTKLTHIHYHITYIRTYVLHKQAHLVMGNIPSILQYFLPNMLLAS